MVDDNAGSRIITRHCEIVAKHVTTSRAGNSNVSVPSSRDDCLKNTFQAFNTPRVAGRPAVISLHCVHNKRNNVNVRS